MAPLGNKNWFMEMGITNVVEADWWDEYVFNRKETENGSAKATIICTPCQHFSGRSLLDRFKTLWSSWTVIGANGEKFWFGGYVLFIFFRFFSILEKIYEYEKLYQRSIKFYLLFIITLFYTLQYFRDTGYRSVPKDFTGNLDDLPHTPAFKEIGAKYGPFHLAAIPIGGEFEKNYFFLFFFLLYCS